jgi:fibrillarin-like pre-rRNA processing protein
LALGLKAPPLLPGENVLYLGAATGTTASHVADLVGPQGIVYAVEKSPRAFARLLASAGRWPNLAPLLRDVREPESYVGLVPMVGALYMDIPQPDQVEIALRNASLFLRPGGRLYLALKLSSLGRARTPKEHLEAAVRELREHFQLDAPIPLEPFYRRHAFIAGRSRA